MDIRDYTLQGPYELKARALLAKMEDACNAMPDDVCTTKCRGGPDGCWARLCVLSEMFAAHESEVEDATR